MSAVTERKRKMVASLVEMHLDQYKKSGAELVMRLGRFVAAKTIEVTLSEGGTRSLRGNTSSSIRVGAGIRQSRAAAILEVSTRSLSLWE
jgi:pyruvate/2-oxoglutarate dehydrogenase complex dihydrolipoamide dehydrogenase (E3) component